MANHLQDETSPYLLQHANNPVDWYPWGEEAMRLAAERDKPILLSIGYAACHWCHVMAHESFEDEMTAAQMNAEFINVKVDREERPDIDSIYMQAVNAMVGRGGWPMTVFLTPDGKPFYAGTYFPNEPRHGMPSFRQILSGVTQAWNNDRGRVLGSAAEVTEQLQALSDLGFDEGTLEFLLRESVRSGDGSALEMARLTLRKMAEGGMYDHLGGGFARYSVDHRWLVPHFEKMLYDNSQLARVYLHAWQLTGEELYRRVTEETLDYVLREMRHPEGGFYSSQDADSEGVEGKFYVWSADEIRHALGEDAEAFMTIYGVSDAGNWEGSNILNLHLDLASVAEKMGAPADALDARMSAARATLYEIRSRRIWPGLDDKVLTSWNGLMLGAFAEAGQALNRPDYVEAARSSAGFLYRTMRRDSGRLFRTWKTGSKAKYNAYLEDYAYLADGLLALYEATFDERWVSWAQELAELMLSHFRDTENGGFFDTSDDHEQLIQRPKELQDNAVPSGNAMAAGVLLKLSLLTVNGDYWTIAEKSVATMAKLMSEYPSGFGQWLTAATFVLSEPRELALIGSAEEISALVAVAREAYRPFQVVAAAEEGAQPSLPLLADRPRVEGKGTAYLCRRFVCQAPTTDAEQLRLQLESA